MPQEFHSNKIIAKHIWGKGKRSEIRKRSRHYSKTGHLTFVLKRIGKKGKGQASAFGGTT